MLPAERKDNAVEKVLVEAIVTSIFPSAQARTNLNRQLSNSPLLPLMIRVLNILAKLCRYRSSTDKLTAMLTCSSLMRASELGRS